MKNALYVHAISVILYCLNVWNTIPFIYLKIKGMVFAFGFADIKNLDD
tara:strand:- start:3542 stop:3685 length:144 start_codon:yes stop_codon:yes gene_type:complete